MVRSGADGTLASWDINTTPLESSMAAASNGDEEERWAAVLGDPELVREMRDYFVYAQIKTQGEDSLEPRNVPGGRGGDVRKSWRSGKAAMNGCGFEWVKAWFSEPHVSRQCACLQSIHEPYTSTSRY